jgi:hypothetical protein
MPSDTTRLSCNTAAATHVQWAGCQFFPKSVCMPCYHTLHPVNSNGSVFRPDRMLTVVGGWCRAGGVSISSMSHAAYGIVTAYTRQHVRCMLKRSQTTIRRRYHSTYLAEAAVALLVALCGPPAVGRALHHTVQERSGQQLLSSIGALATVVLQSNTAVQQSSTVEQH